MTDLPVLSPAEARVLGCLIEKKELTPDVYPLTLNGAHAAANQKTAREPVMALELTEVRRALSSLEQKGLVRQAFASRVERYEHLMAQRFSLTTPQIAIVGLLLLRGAQTAHELLARSERMARFGSIEELRDNLDLMIGRRPPLVQLLERAPGQREERYVHLLSGPVEMTAVAAPWQPPATSSDSGLEARVKALEEEVAALRAKIEALAGL
ncbi:MULTISPECIES: DUF480 domain-containing protein [unclassified Mesorhizobium]|uniref:YceH family protein n=1 Tax=unclassified Mesorhizobium TaxID=325217 RepID=UPI002416BC00|nr:MULTISPECIES: DUF480 domain-containing protein [unclassified Mesorhizobium]WFP63918.1 DUF480 domain-containing protein [Mesorhizobium sp. WSM4904]WFP77189.1 DUF480 domain-containing protein [Mesorhizobium sp. WSM4906]